MVEHAQTRAKPSPVAMPADYAALLARAIRLTTPCGDGDMVWHMWGERQAGALPLVMLHGGSGSWTHWIRNIDALVAAGYQIWLPDLPGLAIPPRHPPVLMPMPWSSPCTWACSSWAWCPAS